MANDFRTFNLQLDGFARKVGVAAGTVQKRVAFDLFGRIVRRTPVDTGRARGSWTIAVNQADRAVLPPAPPRHKYPRPHVPVGITVKPGDTIWISNNLPYITALEDGHSKQTPPHAMVALSIEEVQAKYDTLAREGLKDAGL